MCALIHNCVFDSRQAVEDHGSSATLNIVDGSLCEASYRGGGNCPSVDNVQCLCHRVCFDVVSKLWLRAVLVYGSLIDALDIFGRIALARPGLEGLGLASMSRLSTTKSTFHPQLPLTTK